MSKIPILACLVANKMINNFNKLKNIKAVSDIFEIISRNLKRQIKNRKYQLNKENIEFKKKKSRFEKTTK